MLVLAMLLVVDVSKAEQDTMIIYSSMEQYRGEELQRQLDEHFPDQTIKVMYVSTAKAAAKLKVEKTGSDADIVVGLDTAYMEKIKANLADLHGIREEPYLPQFSLAANDYAYITWEKQAGSFIINDTVLEKYDLPVPQSYEDLLDPVYKGLIAMPDPKTSGTGYFFYKGLVNVWGEQQTLAYFDRLSANVKTFTESGSGPIKLLKQGEIAIGLGLTFQAVEEINGGSPFSIITPSYGSPYSLTGTAMIKGREDDADVQAVFSYIIHEFFHYDKAYFSPEQILQGQKNMLANYPQNIEYADMEGISDIHEKERLLNLWKY